MNKQKYTTIRMGDKSSFFFPNDEIEITVGWDIDSVEPLNRGIIESVEVKTISEITTSDLLGESPDCQSVEAVKYVLGSIYKKVAFESTIVTIIKWRYF